MSRAEDDAVAAIFEPRASPPGPDLTITDAQRRALADSILASIAEHQRQIRASKVVRDHQRVGAIINALSNSLSVVHPQNRRSRT